MNSRDVNYYRMRYGFSTNYGFWSGIDPLCGWDWIQAHEHDLDGWTPTIEIDRPGSHFKFTVKDKQILKQVSRIIREK